MRPGIDLNGYAEDIHENAVDKGWWDEPRAFGEVIALIHCELSEAMEEYRDHHEPTEVYYRSDKPEGVPIELADAFIRILDYCGAVGIDFEAAFRTKVAFNRTRPHKHGGKRI